MGGGFGGIYTARHLERFFDQNKIEITLINKTNYFLFTPLLHEVATGGLTSDSIIEPIREIFRGEHMQFVEDIVIEIDKKNKKVKTASAEFGYDFLVLSPGAETNYMNIPGACEYTFSLKNLPDAIALRNHVVETCERAVNTKNKELLSVALIGGGATGVELAGEMMEYMEHTLLSYYKDSGFTKDDINIYLITNTPDLIFQFPLKMRFLALDKLYEKKIKVMLNTMIKRVDHHMITLDNDSKIKAHTIVWIGGVLSMIPDIKGVEGDERGRMNVNEYLQVVTDTQIFSLGDAAGSYPMLAQVAVQQARTVAKNIWRMVNNRDLESFKFLQKGLLLSIGQWYAIGHFGRITLQGKMMWLLWRIIYLFNFISLRKKIEIAVEWFINFFYPRDISQIK